MPSCFLLSITLSPSLACLPYVSGRVVISGVATPISAWEVLMVSVVVMIVRDKRRGL